MTGTDPEMVRRVSQEIPLRKLHGECPGAWRDGPVAHRCLMHAGHDGACLCPCGSERPT